MKFRKGISLIVLIITIIVMIIIAGAIIVNLTNTNIIDKASDATFKNNFSQINEMLEFANGDNLFKNLGKNPINVLEKDGADYSQRLKETLKYYDKNNILDKEIDGYKYAELLQIYNGKLYQSDKIADSTTAKGKELSNKLSSMGIATLFLKVTMDANDKVFAVGTNKSAITNLKSAPEGKVLEIPNTYVNADGTETKITSYNIAKEEILSGNYRNYMSNIEKVIVSKDITYIGPYSFEQLSCIKEVILPETVTDFSFTYCANLITTDLPKALGKIGGYAFKNCVKLGSNKSEKEESINLSETKVTQIGDSAFAWCSELKNIRLPETLTSMGTGTFEYCTSLKEIYIPGNLGGIQNNTFNTCTSLQTVKLSEGIEFIAAYAFTKCSSTDFKDIIIPKSVKKICENAFTGANPGLVITVKNTKEYCDKNFEVGWNKINSNGNTLFKTIYEVSPDGTVEDE